MKSLYLLFALTMASAEAWTPLHGISTRTFAVQKTTLLSLFAADDKSAKDFAYDTADAMEDVADDAKEAAQDAKEELDPDRAFQDKSTLGKVKEVAVDAKDTIKEKAGDVKDYVKEKAGDAKEKVKDVASNIKETVVGEDEDD